MKMSFTAPLGASVPCLGADVFCVLPNASVGLPRREVAVVSVEWGGAEGVGHLEDAEVHPRGPPRLRVLRPWQHPLGDAAEVMDPFAAILLGLDEVRVGGVQGSTVLVRGQSRDRLGGRGQWAVRVAKRLTGEVGAGIDIVGRASRFGDGRGRRVVETASATEGVVVVEVVTPVVEGGELGMGGSGLVIVVEGTAEAERVLVVEVIDIVAPVIVVGSHTFQDKRGVLFR